jgi:hypothetical protein
MSAFGRKADIDCAGGGHKKARYKTGLSIFGSGGRIWDLAASATDQAGGLSEANHFTVSASVDRDQTKNGTTDFYCFDQPLPIKQS